MLLRFQHKDMGTTQHKGGTVETSYCLGCSFTPWFPSANKCLTSVFRTHLQTNSSGHYHTCPPSNSPCVILEGSMLEGSLHGFPWLFGPPKSGLSIPSALISPFVPLPSHNNLCSSSPVVTKQATGHVCLGCSLPRLFSQLAAWYSSACSSELIQMSPSQCDLKFNPLP